MSGFTRPTLPPRAKRAGGLAVIRFDLVGAPYPIWREVQLHPESALDDLHVVIQAVMGWDDAHLRRVRLAATI